MNQQLELQPATYRTHSFTEYGEISLGMHKKAILDFLKNNPQARVLDVGCGEGNALQELSQLCQEAGYRVIFAGLDIAPEKPRDFPRNMKYISADISTMDVREFKSQFDLILSVNVFPYIIHKEKALSNVAKMLSANGKAFISLEPFYFGPYGTQLFAGSNCCTWDESYRNILVRASFSPVVVDSEAFCEYALPTQCLSKISQREGKNGEPTIMVPVPFCYSPDVEDSLLEHYEIVKKDLIEKGRATNWDLFEFLSVNTPNVNGHHLCGTEGFRPFLSGIITPYFRQQELSPEAVAVLLMMPERYDPHSRKANWKETETFKFAQSCCLESLKLIGNNCLSEAEQQKVQRAVQAEINSAQLSNMSQVFSPKTMIQLALTLAILAVIIKMLLNLQPSSIGLRK